MEHVAAEQLQLPPSLDDPMPDQVDWLRKRIRHLEDIVDVQKVTIAKYEEAVSSMKEQQHVIEDQQQQLIHLRKKQLWTDFSLYFISSAIFVVAFNALMKSIKQRQ